MENKANSARLYIKKLLDENSFIEFGAEIIATDTDSNQKTENQKTDGVVTGYGLINGNPIYIYAQSSDVMGGSIGRMHSEKICNIYDKAMKMGCPIIGVLDSSGLRLNENVDAIDSFSKIYKKQVRASKMIPQLMLIKGMCGGSGSIIAGLSDIVFMEKEAQMFVNSPNSLSKNHVDKQNTAAIQFQASIGNVDFYGTRDDLLAKIRQIIDILPLNNKDKNIINSKDDANRLLTLNENDKIDDFVEELADNRKIIELKSYYARDILTAFMRLNGHIVGIVANRQIDNDNLLSPNGCYKATKFVQFCDNFNIPIITLINIKGFKRSIEDEKEIIRAAGTLIKSYASSKIPKINLIMKNAYSTAYNIISSKAIGADITYAFSNAKIGIIPSDMAVKMMYENLDEEELKLKSQEYEITQKATMVAAKGLIDTIIEPKDTRKYLIATIEMLFTKRQI